MWALAVFILLLSDKPKNHNGLEIIDVLCMLRAPQGGVPCYMLYGFSMGLLYAITKLLTLL